MFNPFYNLNFRNALTEICVLSDVLNIICVREKKYMVLDSVPQPPAKPKPAISLLAKKKVL